MRLRAVPFRSLAYYWRTNLAVLLAVGAGTSVLTGALLVGDSMRESLRETALGRLGLVDHALVSSRFIGEDVATELELGPESSARFDQICPAIILRGSSTNPETGARSSKINILGVDERFAELRRSKAIGSPVPPTAQSVVLNESLATELGVSKGDDVLLRFSHVNLVPVESTLGKKTDTTKSLRLTVSSVVPAQDIAAFTLRPRQSVSRNAFVQLSTLQRVLDRRDRVNTVLVSATSTGEEAASRDIELLNRLLRSSLEPTDLGLSIRLDEPREYIAIESETMLLEPSIEQLIERFAVVKYLDTSPILTYLANRISREQSGIPYSTVSALEPALEALRLVGGDSVTELLPGEILLNQWAADDLSASPGDQITLDYYVDGPFGQLETQQAGFAVRGVVAMDQAGADPGFTPPYPGITDSENLSDWDPPFPMDLEAIREKDETYWDEYHASPKAFVTLADGQQLWAKQGDRFGRVTSIRVHQRRDDESLAVTAASIERELLSDLKLADVGLGFDPVRVRQQDSSAGSTDFGMLFIGFSFFLIISAALLMALLYRLGVERRASQIGLLRASGFAPRQIGMMFAGEGVILAALGGVLGVVGSLGFAALMLAGLRSSWSDAVGTPFLRLHVSTSTLIVGLLSGSMIAVGSVYWSIRGLLRRSPRELLSGSVSSGMGKPSGRTRTAIPWVAVVSILCAIGLVGFAQLGDGGQQAPLFFLSGVAALVGSLALLSRRVVLAGTVAVKGTGKVGLLRLGARNCGRHPGRSMLTAGSIASATFLISALQAFHMDPGADPHDRNSGTGGFARYAESAAPLFHDLNTPAGREALNILADESDGLRELTAIPFRLRDGDESSCLNLFKPDKPRIIGATDAMITRGGFGFASTMAQTPQEQENPWALLNATFPDGAIPAIGDLSAVQWQLHLGLGKDLVIEDDRGNSIHLRFVALLSGSALQDEVIVAEQNFIRLFPSIGGYSFFLLDTGSGSASAVETVLERELSGFGFDVASTTTRLAGYLSVQNTYLSTFQTLGGFGLVLGTIGLGAVLLRSVWERRSEFALMRALGFSRAALGRMALAESLVLLLAGMLAGLLSALIAIAPHVLHGSGVISWTSMGMMLLAVFATGAIAAIVAVTLTLRGPLIPALRSE